MCKNCQAIKWQNDRIRAWFKQRTGLKTDLLSQHMNAIDEMLQRTEKPLNRTREPACLKSTQVAPVS